jgi:hypothetical protein
MLSSRLNRLGFSVGLAVATPMLFPGCEGIRQDAKPTVVVIDIPKSVEPLTDGTPKKEGPSQARKTTVLNISPYDDKVLEARLSVISLDNTLDRILLDPKVTFIMRSGESWDAIPGCIEVSSCEIPPQAKTGKPAPVIFKAYYTPSATEPFLPSVSEPLRWEPGESERSIQ